MGYFHFTKRRLCAACLTTFTITSVASKYCQNRDCQNKRRRDDYAARRDGTGAYARRSQSDQGSAAHLERALESTE